MLVWHFLLKISFVSIRKGCPNITSSGGGRSKILGGAMTQGEGSAERIFKSKGNCRL